MAKELNERNVGKRAAIMLQAAVRRNTRGFSAHIAGSPTKSIREAKGAYRGQTYVVAGKKKYYLRKIILKMERHGFVQHLGVDTIRRGGERTRKKPHTRSYRYRHHQMQMQARPFLDKAIEESGVREYVLEKITEIRCEEILAHIRTNF